MSRKDSSTRTKILDATWKLMEQSRGQGVRMSDIAKAAGISRQAVYLHFETRTDLMIATVQYVDEIKGLDERLQVLETASSGAALLDALADVWGNYIPEIYGIAKAMLVMRDEDEASAAAWTGCMSCLRDACEQVVKRLKREGLLAKGWGAEAATDMLFNQLSIHNWEQLTIESGWSTARYVKHLKLLLHRTFVDEG